MADNDAVIIKGIRGGLLLLLDDQEEWGPLLAELGERLRARKQFFRGATVTVNLGRRIIDEPEWAGLRETLAHYEMQTRRGGQHVGPEPGGRRRPRGAAPRAGVRGAGRHGSRGDRRRRAARARRPPRR